MTWWQYAEVTVTLALLLVGLIGPSLLTLYMNILCDRYDAILKDEEPTHD